MDHNVLLWQGMLRVGAPAPVPAAPWLGDYPAARADAGVAHGAAAARGHA